MSLNRNEWPTGVLEKIEPYLVDRWISFRDESGIPVVPSPDPEAHIRDKSGTSRHCLYDVNGDPRLSDGTDIFIVHNFQAAELWSQLLKVPQFGGIGIYFDTDLSNRRRVMLHTDLRVERLLWVCPNRNKDAEPRQYIYYHQNPSLFLKVLGNELEAL